MLLSSQISILRKYKAMFWILDDMEWLPASLLSLLSTYITLLFLFLSMKNSRKGTKWLFNTEYVLIFNFFQSQFQMISSALSGGAFSTGTISFFPLILDFRYNRNKKRRRRENRIKGALNLVGDIDRFLLYCKSRMMREQPTLP